MTETETAVTVNLILLLSLTLFLEISKIAILAILNNTWKADGRDKQDCNTTRQDNKKQEDAVNIAKWRNAVYWIVTNTRWTQVKIGSRL